MAWWQWILLGLALSALELATPGGFYLIFFGVSAILVGLASLVGFLVPAWFEWLAFSVGSIVMLLLFRRRLMQLIAARGRRRRLAGWRDRAPARDDQARRNRPRGDARHRVVRPQRTRQRAGPRSARARAARRRLDSIPRSGTVTHGYGFGHVDCCRDLRVLPADRDGEDGCGRAAAERLHRRAARTLRRHAAGRLPYPRAVRRRHPLSAHA